MGALWAMSHPTGYAFGRGAVQARLYNKTLETREKANDAYGALLTARNGERYDPHQDVWRLEFQLRREGVKGFRLYAPPEVDDSDEEIEAELAAEELQHVGTLPRFFARLPELFAYLSRYWLRLVETSGETEHTNRSRLPMDPTWVVLREQFALLVTAVPLDEDSGQLVRGARYSGKNRILRWLALGVVKSLEVVDASPTSAALLTLQRWVERTVEGEVARITAKCDVMLQTANRFPAGPDRGWRNGSGTPSRWSIGCRCFSASLGPKVSCRLDSSQLTRSATYWCSTWRNSNERPRRRAASSRCCLHTSRRSTSWRGRRRCTCARHEGDWMSCKHQSFVTILAES